MKIKERIEKIAASYITTIVLLAIYSLILAIATFVEREYGTAVVKQTIYYSPLLFLLHFLLVVNFVVASIKHNLFETGRWGLILSHLAFVVILFGALVTHVFGEEGILHLREGMSDNRMAVQTSDGVVYHDLPFSAELIKFTLTYYPGSSSPSSYESELILHADGTTKHANVYMNNVIDIKGYRLFQASYDADQQGTVLSVNKDAAGRNITYTGYLILIIGFVFCLIGKKSRLHTLGKQLKGIRSKTTIICLLFLLSNLTSAQANEGAKMKDAVQQYAVDKDHADRFGAIPVQATNRRIIPINTFSSEILRKIHKAEKVGTLNSDQFLISLLAMPDVWIRISFIANTNDELASFYSLTKGECAYIEVFDENGVYKMQSKVDEAYSKMANQRTAFDKDIIKLDEKINILHQLMNGQMLKIYPKHDDANHTWYAPGDDLSIYHGQDSMFVSRVMDWYLSEVFAATKSRDWTKANQVLEMITTYQNSKNTIPGYDAKKIEMEVKYNKMEIFRICKILYLSLGGLLVILSLLSLYHENKWMKYTKYLLVALVSLVFLFHMAGMGMRWYIGGYAPWSNSYETMVYVAWATALAGLLFIRRSIIAFALAILFAGIILFVSSLNWMDPQINPLVPVLKSPWLMFHVSVIVAAYGFFGISFLIGVTNLVLMSITPKGKLDAFADRIRELSIVNEMSLIVGLILMTVGTFLGAVWANESWGRYWGWDPKETWALITVVVYVMVTHIHLIKKWNSLWLFNLMSVIAFASVLMTFFGVNYFLSGMHSYGQNDNISNVFAYLYAVAFVVLLLGVISSRGRHLEPVENKLPRSRSDEELNL